MSEIGSQEQRADVKSEIARVLIAAMLTGDTPWQRPWSASSMRPMNPTSGNAYKGINRILLSLSGASDPRWVTYQQATKAGWQVRRGAKGSPIVKLVEVGATRDQDGVSGRGEREAGEEGSGGRKAFALRRYTVFNASQVDGMPELPVAAPPKEFEVAERAEATLAALRETGLRIIHGGDRACYVPSLDEIRLPAKSAFPTAYAYYSVALHEGAHSTLHETRLNRVAALGQRWGDEAYSLEELRAEICSAILAAETGVPMAMSEEHVRNHAAYLNSWVKNLKRDPMAIFSAAKDAEQMAGYMLELEAKRTAIADHASWIRSYESAERASELGLAVRR